MQTTTERPQRAAAALAAAGLLAVAPAAPAQTPTQVVSFPSPYARSASPTTEISFRGATAAALQGTVVSTSRSGRHSGALRDHADGRGVSFVPARRFFSGERVRVRVPAGVRVVGGEGRSHEFTTARIVEGFATEGPTGAPRGRGNFTPLRSRPDLAPPTIRALVAEPGRRSGYVLIAPKRGSGQGGPMIVDDAGIPVFFRPMPAGVRATDFRVQTYRGRPVLTWWQGRARGGSGRGDGVVLDTAYRLVRRVQMANGFSADLHEFVLTDRDTALMVSYVPVRRNLGAVKGSTRGIAVDCVAQEVELSTGRVRFEWHALDHVPLSDSLRRPESARKPYDYFHINSLNVDPDGGYVISARGVSQVLKLDAAGTVQWSLGGESGTLRRGEGTRFDLQHDAVPHGNGLYTIFDNSAKGIRKASRAITVRVDAARRTATLVRSVAHPANVLSGSQANHQVLADGHLFVGWGSQGRASEFDARGRLLLDLKLPFEYDTYRAYRAPWSAHPAPAPRVAAEARDQRTAVYASWNGSTETATWTVLAGPSADRLAPVKTTRWTALETAISVGTRERYVAVQANDSAGRALRRSEAVRVRGRD
jgi:Arylsulfotransferase (ASST)